MSEDDRPFSLKMIWRAAAVILILVVGFYLYLIISSLP